MPRTGRSTPIAALAILLLLVSSGCSPYRTATPASQIRPNYFDTPRASREPVDFARLCQPTPEVYQLAPRDVLGIYIEGIVPAETTSKQPSLPPVNYFDQDPDLPPSMGYPIPIREDGTISLPLVPPISLTGLSVAEAEYAIRKAYTIDRRLLRPEEARIIVTLMMPRTYSVLVIREDLGGVSPAGWGTEPTRHAATAPIQLRAYENDLLHALSATGGLPGTDAKNEVVILHGAASTPELRDEARSALEDPLTRQQFFDRYRNITRIPLRIGPKDPAVSISTQDIILQRGDVVFVESREAETFYTGGLLPGGQFAIPRDYDLDVLGAVSIAGGSLSPAAGGNNYGRSMGYGGSLGSLLPPTRVIVIRKGHDTMQVIKLDLRTALTDPQQRILIQPNDLIMLEYTEFEMTMNAILSTVSFNLDLQTLFNH